jgi:hypothetical protein
MALSWSALLGVSDARKAGESVEMSRDAVQERTEALDSPAARAVDHPAANPRLRTTDAPVSGSR